MILVISVDDVLLAWQQKKKTKKKAEFSLGKRLPEQYFRHV